MKEELYIQLYKMINMLQLIVKVKNHSGELLFL